MKFISFNSIISETCRTLLICVILLFFISLSYAEESSNSDSVQQEGLPSIPNENGIEETSMEDDSSSDMILESENNTLEDDPQKKSFAEKLMPKYGNWCGANYPKDMSTASEPIDLLDQACKKHDVCYENQGYLDCGCDNEFNQELITGLKENSYATTEARYARAVHHYFNASPCNGDHSTKIGPSRAVHGVVKHVGGKAVKVIKALPVVGDKIKSEE